MTPGRHPGGTRRASGLLATAENARSNPKPNRVGTRHATRRTSVRWQAAQGVTGTSRTPSRGMARLIRPSRRSRQAGRQAAAARAGRLPPTHTDRPVSAGQVQLCRATPNCWTSSRPRSPPCSGGAQRGTGPELLEEWHSRALPLFLDRLGARLGESTTDACTARSAWSRPSSTSSSTTAQPRRSDLLPGRLSNAYIKPVLDMLGGASSPPGVDRLDETLRLLPNCYPTATQPCDTQPHQTSSG